MLRLCAAQLKFWFWTDLGRENSASYYGQGRQLFFTFLTMVTRWSRSTSNFLLWLVKIWQGSSCRKFMRLETCLLWQLKLTEFVSTCDVLNCLLPLDVQNEIQLLSGVFCYSWLDSLLVFWLRNGIVFVFHLAWYLRELKSLKRFWAYLIAFRSCISNGKPE